MDLLGHHANRQPTFSFPIVAFYVKKIQLDPKDLPYASLPIRSLQNAVEHRFFRVSKQKRYYATALIELPCWALHVAIYEFIVNSTLVAHNYL